MIDEKKLWEDCVAFHGHACGGLTMGYKASLYVMELLDLETREETSDFRDEGLVCIAENDACGVDAIQVILACSVGKGNLLFHMTGKHAYSFYRRDNGKSVRLILRDSLKKVPRAQALDYFQSLAPQELFEVKETTIALPERARMFSSYPCEICGEVTGENWIRLQDGKKVCLDCYAKYDRFHVE